jgi:hypothetical protein
MGFPGSSAFLKSVVMAAGLAWLCGCEGTETTNPNVNTPGSGLHGKLVDGTGQPRAGVSVKAFQAGKSPLGKAVSKTSAAGDSAITDAQGYYGFDSLQGGQYNLIGEYNGGGLVVLIPQVEYSGGAAPRDLGTDTLRLPGRITGTALLDGAGKGGIFCYLTGTSFLTISDETGKFWVSGIPQGKYDLNYAYPGLQTLKDTGILIQAGETTTLPPRELGYDTAFPPPAPTALRVRYDTLSGVAVLGWTRPQVSDIDGFVVYRINPLTSSPERLNLALVRDTVFRDTLFWSPTDTGSLTASYQVKSQDRANNLSTVFSPMVSVAAAGPGSVRTYFSLSLKTAFGDTAVMRDTLRILAAYENPLRGHSRLSWRLSGGAVPLRESLADLPGKGSDTLVVSLPEPGRYTIVVEAEDASGVVWKDSLAVQVLRDPPAAHAGRDAVSRTGTPVRLTGRGEDRFGKIVQYAWDFDADGVFEDSSAVNGDVSRTYPDTGRQVHVFRVTDDDGNSAYDTVDFVVGAEFTGLIIESDMVFRKAGSPYSISGKLVIQEGVMVTVEPGVRFQLSSGGGFYVRGGLICAGTAKDSIIFTGSGGGEGGIHFEDGMGSVVRDSTHLSGSLLRYVSFKQSPGIMMHNTVVTVEDCLFTDANEGGFPGLGHNAIIELDYFPLDDDTKVRTGLSWICRRNRFQGSSEATVYAYFSQNSPVRVDVYFHRNETTVGWIMLMTSAQNRGVVSMERNTVRLRSDPPNSVLGGFGFGSGGAEDGVKYVFRNNLMIAPETGSPGSSEAIFIQNETPAELDHNEFRNWGKVLFDQGLVGRFHHNIVDGGLIDFNAANGIFRADSNSFGAGVQVSSMLPAVLIPQITTDFRNNYWSTTDLVAIRARVVGTGGTPDPEVAPVEPILLAPPPGVGRQNP